MTNPTPNVSNLPPMPPPSGSPPGYMTVDIGHLVSSTPSGYRRRLNQYHVTRMNIRIPETGESSKVDCPVCQRKLGVRLRSKAQNQKLFLAILVGAVVLTIVLVVLNFWEVAIAPGVVALFYLLRYTRAKTAFILPGRRNHKYWLNGKPVSRDGSLTLVALVALGIGGAVAVGLATDRQAREAVVAKYGDTAVKLCSQIQTKNYNSGSLKEGTKVVFINTGSMLVFDYYQKDLPAADKATDKNDVQAVACVTEGSVPYDTAKYNMGSTCTMNRRKHDVYIMDLATSKQIGHAAFPGDDDAECPQTISVKQGETKHIDVYGSNPTTGNVIKWIYGRK